MAEKRNKKYESDQSEHVRKLASGKPKRFENSEKAEEYQKETAQNNQLLYNTASKSAKCLVSNTCSAILTQTLTPDNEWEVAGCLQHSCKDSSNAPSTSTGHCQDKPSTLTGHCQEATDDQLKNISELVREDIVRTHILRFFNNNNEAELYAKNLAHSRLLVYEPMSRSAACSNTDCGALLTTSVAMNAKWLVQAFLQHTCDLATREKASFISEGNEVHMDLNAALKRARELTVDNPDLPPGLFTVNQEENIFSCKVNSCPAALRITSSDFGYLLTFNFAHNKADHSLHNTRQDELQNQESSEPQDGVTLAQVERLVANNF